MTLKLLIAWFAEDLSLCARVFGVSSCGIDVLASRKKKIMNIYSIAGGEAKLEYTFFWAYL